jgi:hypothetical protein
MKNTLAIILAICLSVFFNFNIYAQIQLAPYYTFSQNTGTYTNISGGNVLGTGAGMNSNAYKVAIPFTVNVNGSNYDTAWVSINGHLSFPISSSSAYWIIQSTSAGFAAVAGFSTDLISTSTSDLRYDVVGTSPNREFVVQWTNFTHALTTALSTSFQIRIKETTNEIRFVYNNVSVSNSSQLSVQVGIRGQNNSIFTCRSGNWSSSTLGSVNTSSINTSSSNLPSNGLTYIFTPPACSVPVNQPTSLSLTPGGNNINMSFTAASPAVDKYLIVRTINGPLNTSPVNGTYYTAGNNLGNGTVVYTGPNTSFNNTGLNLNTNYTYTIFAYDDTCTTAPIYKTTTPLTGTVKTLGPTKYIWLPTSGNNNWNTATNWQPIRNISYPDDTLVFNQGGNPIISNVGTTYMSTLQVSNNTNPVFKATGTRTLTYSNTFTLDTGCSMTLDTNVSILSEIFGGNPKATINGTLNLTGNAIYNGENSNTVINGTINVSQNAEFKRTCNTGCKDALFFGSTAIYNHNRDGGLIPRGVYEDSSTVNINGIINTQPDIDTGQVFGNFSWNCPQQASNITLNQRIAIIVGTLHIASTNNSQLRLDELGEELVVGELKQTGGNVLLTSSAKTLRVLGNLTLDSGTMNLSTYQYINYNTKIPAIYLHGNMTQGANHTITRTGSIIRSIVFCGNTPQTISAYGTTNNIGYELNNHAGAKLSGTLTVTSNNINLIQRGSWQGSGAFSYVGTQDTLYYDTEIDGSMSPVEWPAVNSPSRVFVDVPANRQNIQKLPGNRVVDEYFMLMGGIIQLNQYNLTIGGNSYFGGGKSNKVLVVADSTGQYIQRLPVVTNPNNDNYYVMPVGCISDTAVSTYPTSIRLNVNSQNRYLGMRVKDTKHPNDTSTSNYLDRYWILTDDGDTAFMKLYVQLNFPLNEVNGKQLGMHIWDGSSWRKHPSDFYWQIYNSVMTIATYDKINPQVLKLNGAHITGRKNQSTTYVWTGSIDKDYSKPGNWIPNRTTNDISDILVFNNGQTDSVYNVYPEKIKQLIITNNTKLKFTKGNLTLTDQSQYILENPDDSVNYSLQIDSGSALYINTLANGLGITVKGYGRIAGRLEVINTHYQIGSNIYFQENKTTITNSGTLAVNSANGTHNYNGNIHIDGTYEHLYSVYGGSIPLATWGQNSVALIKGGLSHSYSPEIVNLVYDAQAPANNTPASLLPKITNKLHIISTGTGQWVFNTSQNGNYNTTKKYIQTGGDVSINGYIAVQDSFIQTGGKILSSSGTLNFSGTSGRQYVTFKDSVPTGGLTYRLSNSSGISLNGNGSWTSADFTIKNGGGIRVSVPGSNLITSNFRIVYDSVNTTLSYDTLSGYNTTTHIADTILFPPLNGPTNLTTNIGEGSVLIIPWNRQVPGSLTMMSGDINIGSSTLTLGKSNSSIGVLAYTAGNILLTSGEFKRWYNTTSLPTSAGNNSVGFYPIISGSHNRHVSIFFSTSSALSNAGTISIGHNHLSGHTTVAMQSGPDTVNKRYNSVWPVTIGDGIAATGTIGVKLLTSGILGNDIIDSNKLRITKDTNIAGTFLSGFGSYPGSLSISHQGISLSTLNGNIYIGAISKQDTSHWRTVKTGNWNDSTVWNKGYPPLQNSTVFITTPDTITVSTPSFAKSININRYASINVTTGFLDVDSAIICKAYGRLKLSGGVIELGPTGGGKSPLISDGTIDVTDGILNVNGYILANQQSVFSQSGGSINIDPNAAGILANSAQTTALSLLNNSQSSLTGGNITIVDPPASVSYSSIFSSPIAGKGHTTIIGHWNSVENGTFTISTFSKFGNLVINRPTSENSTSSSLLQIEGDFVLNHPLATYTINTTLGVKGNVIVNAGTKLFAYGTLLFNGNGWQKLSGSGTIRNGNTSTNTTGNFRNLKIHGKVIAEVGNISFSEKLSFDSLGRIFMGNATLICSDSIPDTYGNVQSYGPQYGWIVGKYMTRPRTDRAAILYYPVGDTNSYGLVTVSVMKSSIAKKGGLTVRLRKGDHPLLQNSAINPLQSLNQQFIIDTAEGINIRTNSLTPNFRWFTQYEDLGMQRSNLAVANYDGNKWNYGKTVLSTDTLASSYIWGNNIVGTFQIGNTGTSPSIDYGPDSLTVCPNSSAVFSVHTYNTTGHAWQVNNGSGWSYLSNNTTYSGVSTNTLKINIATIAMNNYQYRCIVYNTQDTLISSIATLKVNNTLVPHIVINALPGDSICNGTNIVFKATTTNGGASAQYLWTINGTVVGTNSDTFSSNTLTNNDTVRCVLTSSISCASPTSDTSNGIIIKVNALTTPTINIASNNGASLCNTTTATFTATATNAGSMPSYQWKKNGIDVGTNTTTYTDTNLTSGDAVWCVLSTIQGCVTNSAVSSNTIIISIGNGFSPSLSITSGSSSTICAGSSVTFTANGINGGTSPLYQWRKNGIVVGSNSSTYTTNTLSTGDIISCKLTSNLACAVPDTALSNNITITVTPNIVPSLTITTMPNDTVCNGTNVSFTVTPSNGGTSPAYQWKLNGINVGTNSNTYANSTLSNNDKVTCVMTSSAACPNPATASAGDTIVVIPVVTPSLTISPNPNDTVCAGTPITYTATPVNGGTAPAYQWQRNGLNVGTNTNSYTNTAPGNNDIINCIMTSSATCVSVASTNAMDTIVVTPTSNTSVIINPSPNDTICAGTSITYTATAINGGSSPSYQWKINGNNVGTNSNTYTNSAINNNDIISCHMTSNAVCPSPAIAITSDTVIVFPVVTPSLTITTSPNDTICTGTSVLFTAITTNGGNTPSYQWRLNNTVVGTGTTYTNTSLSNNDIVSCTLTSNQICRTIDTAKAADTISVIQLATPSVTIAVTPGNTVCAGTSVTFIATATNAGSSPTYQWKVNGLNVGTNSSSFTTSSLSNNDIVTCIMNSSLACISKVADTSNSIIMTVNAMLTPDVIVTVNPGSAICTGTSVTFTATPYSGGSAPSYQWKLNGANVGSNNSTYSSSTLNNNDIITCIMTSNANCLSKTSDTSNSITMTVNPLVTPDVIISVAPNDTVCTGTMSVFTATAINGGTSPSYQWLLNGVNVGNNTNIYSNATLSNNDVVSCVINSNANCLSKTSDTSNTITMTVNPILTPSVSIAVSPNDTICTGTSVTFTATTTSAGTSPNYQWTLNGLNTGSNSPTYTTSSLSNNDIITCKLTSSAACTNPVSVTSNSFKMTVNPIVTPTVTINATPGVVVGPWASISFKAIATNGGILPTYQWKRNGTNIPGANTDTYVGTTNASLAAGDIICVFVKSNAACAIPDTSSNCAEAISINTSVSSYNNGRELKIYPNPNEGQFVIEGKTSNSKAITLEVLTTTGQKVYHSEINPTGNSFKTVVNLSNMPAGNYTLRLLNDDINDTRILVIKH